MWLIPALLTCRNHVKKGLLPDINGHVTQNNKLKLLHDCCSEKPENKFNHSEKFFLCFHKVLKTQNTGRSSLEKGHWDAVNDLSSWVIMTLPGLWNGPEKSALFSHCVSEKKGSRGNGPITRHETLLNSSVVLCTYLRTLHALDTWVGVSTFYWILSLWDTPWLTCVVFFLSGSTTRFLHLHNKGRIY